MLDRGIQSARDGDIATEKGAGVAHSSNCHPSMAALCYSDALVRPIWQTLVCALSYTLCPQKTKSENF